MRRAKESEMNFEIFKFAIKALNYVCVIFILIVVTHGGLLLKRDILSPLNTESRLILFSLSLAGSTGVIGFVLNQFKSSPPFEIIILAVVLGIILFVALIVISLAYLSVKDF